MAVALTFTSLVAQTVKRLPTMWTPRFDPWVGKILWRRKWQPTPELLPRKSHGQRSLVGYSPWGCKELDTTEQLNKKLTFTSWVTLGKSFNSHGLVSCFDEWEYTDPPCPFHRQVVRVSHKKMHKNVFEGVKRALNTKLYTIS